MGVPVRALNSFSHKENINTNCTWRGASSARIWLNPGILMERFVGLSFSLDGAVRHAGSRCIMPLNNSIFEDN